MVTAIVSDRIRHLEGIVETETMIAFRAYSKQELEAGFELHQCERCADGKRDQ